MEIADLRLAYDQFFAAAEAAAGQPKAGAWSAELLIAHITAITDLLSVGIAETLAGATARYDNRPSIAEDELRRIVARASTRAGLLAEARHAAERLYAIVEPLTDEQAGRRVPTYIVDGQAVVIDEPRSLRNLLKIQWRIHLPGHTAELLSLSDAASDATR